MEISTLSSLIQQKHIRKLVLEVRAHIRKLLLQNKVKLGWIISKIEDYVSVNRCFKCCSFNHRARDCREEESCSLCAGRHRLRDCTASLQEYKCVNCITFAKFNPTKFVCPNHSSLVKKCSSLQALMEKYRQSTNY